MKKNQCLFWICAGCIFGSKLLAQQTPRPGLEVNGSNTLCSGTPVTFTFVVPIPDGCAIESGTPYELYKDGSLMSSAPNAQINLNAPIEGNYYGKVRFQNAPNRTCAFPQTNESNTITIHKTPVAPSATPVSASVPINNNIVVIAGTNTAGTAGTFHWSLGPNALFQGTQFTTLPAVKGTQTYSLRENRDNCYSPETSISITGEALTAPVIKPLIPQACTGGNVVLTADNVRANAVIKWYDSPTATTPVAIGNRFTTPNLTLTTDFWVTTALDRAESEKALIHVQVDPIAIPAMTLSTPMVCNGQKIKLSAQTKRGFIHWYDAAVHGNLLAISNVYETPALSATANYWAEAVENTCKSERVQTIVTVNPNPALPEISTNAPVCEGETLQIAVTHPTNVQYNWTGTNRFASNNAWIEIPAANEALHQGIYSVYVKDPIFNCVSAIRSINIDILPAPKLNVMGTVMVKDGEKYQLQASGGSQYSWQPETHLSQANLPNPTFQTELTTKNQQAFDYVLTAIGKDNKCSAKATVRIVVLPKTKLVINNVLTPNGDGDNDEWEIDYIYNIHDYTIDIFDDFGNLVYTQTNDYEKNKWNGHFRQTGQLMPTGTYWYRIQFNNGTERPMTGAITLLSNP
ncbi:MAG: hypothetical protein RLZZ628_1122 [Bacteroidota bacterium]|jgi:gliding motility-associated-like protein